MDSFDIEASLRRIDRKLTDDLSSEERRRAVKQFKQLYAEEMSKLASELSRRNKVQENLCNINQKEADEVREIDEESKKKMDKHIENRQKWQETKVKEYKMLEQNWKRKFQEITRKNKAKDRQSYRRAQKMRKDVQEYWNKKSQTVTMRDSSVRHNSHNATLKPYGTAGGYERSYQHQPHHETQYISKKGSVNFPHLTKSKINGVDFGGKSLNKSVADSSLNNEIKTHQERSLKEAQEGESSKIENYLKKLQKIEKTRRKAQERMENEVKEAKRLREMKENPETLAANRKRFNEQLSHKRSIKKRDGSRPSLSNSRSMSKNNLDASIHQHLESKKLLNEREFQQRELVFQQKQRKIKQTQINRLVKDAINQLKHRTLNESIE